MKIYIIILLALMLLFGTACDLKRSNPLDPQSNSNIITPPRVFGLTATGSGPGIQSKYVNLSWDKDLSTTTVGIDEVPNTDGYYIYMGLAYNSAYRRVGSTANISADSTITKVIYEGISPGYMYFKVSGYKVYANADTLEGSLPEQGVLAHVDN